MFSRETIARAGWLALVVAVFAADWLTKRWAVDSLAASPPVIIAPFLRFVYAENTGIAFGVFAGGGALVKWGILALTAAISAVIAFLLWRARRRAESLALALILGGALGNFADRVRFGHVVDFIDAHWGAHHWPTFNIADMTINAGAALLAFLWVFASRP